MFVLGGAIPIEPLWSSGSYRVAVGLSTSLAAQCELVPIRDGCIVVGDISRDKDMTRRTVATSLYAIALFVGGTGSASAQFMGELLPPQSVIRLPRAVAERLDAVAERMGAINANGPSESHVAPPTFPPRGPASFQTFILRRGDPLQGTRAATYRLQNGVLMRVSGTFWPWVTAKCIAYCP